MSDRSDEATKSRDTDELLSETEDLLSGSGVGADTESPSRSRDEPQRDGATDDSSASDSWFSSDEPAASQPETESDTRSGSRLAGLASWLSVDNYFSPRAFLALLLVISVGLLAGGTVIPIGGRMVGMFGVAFAIGLLTSKRRYLEMAVAGSSVGAVSAVFSNAFLAAAGSFQTVAAVGVTVGLVACLIGYYFGRDLRNGLSQDIDSGGR